MSVAKRSTAVCLVGSQYSYGLRILDRNDLAGDYASACHDDIHRRLVKAVGGRVKAKIENHHNFAWKEIHNGKEVIVHRKGATPDNENELGMIPGSMTAKGFIVRGKGNPDSLHSASHGAGEPIPEEHAEVFYTK